MSEALSSRQVEQFVAPISNERSALTLGAMQPAACYSPGELTARMRDIEGEDSPWPTSDALIRSYFQSFAAVDLVAQNGGNNYRLSREGIRIGQPLAGHLVDFSLEVAPTLKDFGGSMNTTSNGGSRPVQTRIDIFRQLIKIGEDNISVSDLGGEIGVDTSRTGVVATNLSDLKIISKIGSDKGEPVVFYTATPELLDLGIKNRDATDQYRVTLGLIQDHFAQRPYDRISNYEITHLLLKFGLVDLPETELLASVSRITSGLASKRGVLVPTRITEDPRTYAIFYTTPKQRSLIAKYLKIIEQAIEGSDDFQYEGRKKMYLLLDDEEKVAALYEKAKQSSSGWLRSAEGQAEAKSKIAQAARTIEGPVTIRRVLRDINESGLRYGYRMVGNHLDHLVEEGFMTKEKTKRGWEFIFTDPES